MKSLLFKRIFQARKKRIMVYNKIRKVWVYRKTRLCRVLLYQAHKVSIPLIMI